jgi:hypothetical protein
VSKANDGEVTVLRDEKKIPSLDAPCKENVCSSALFLLIEATAPKETLKMFKNFKILLGFSVAALSLASHVALAANDPTGPLAESDVRAMLSRQGLDTTASDQIIAALKQVPGAKSSSEIKLSTVLFSHGPNMAFFIDNDNWNFDAAVKYNNKISKIKDLYDVYYYNGGYKSEWVYKWMWVFIPANTTLESLDGAVYGGKVLGRGIAVSSALGTGWARYVGLEAGWVASNKGLGNIFIVAAKVGMTGGAVITTKQQFNLQIGNQKVAGALSVISRVPNIMFPRLEFTQKKVLE